MVTTPSQRVICLMESSVDGRIDESRWSVLYSEKGKVILMFTMKLRKKSGQMFLY